MPKLIFETAFHISEDGELESYWPGRWPVASLMHLLQTSGSAFFAASYMNDPSALEGNSLKTAWLHPYSQTELQAARIALGVQQGTIWSGLDPSIGGKEASDLDYFGMFTIEVLGSKGFCRDYHFDRLQLDQQGQVVEDWLDTQRPDMVILEESSSRGFVYTALMTQVNGGNGTKWPVQVRQAQASRDRGGKHVRLQKMAARFQNKQIMVPGEESGGELVIAPSWSAFVNQWRTFPSGHDDLLDAAYWAQYEAFELPMASGHPYAPEIDPENPLKPHIITPLSQPRGMNTVMLRHMNRRERMKGLRRYGIR